MAAVRIGIIGGSGLDNPQLFSNARDQEVLTEWGHPSSWVRTGTVAGVEVCLLARHGREHTTPPTFVNNRANIAALDQLGCTHLLTTTAVGSLREEIGRGDLVVLDQFIDFTRSRALSFYEKFPPNTPLHAPMADPFHAGLRAELVRGCAQLGIKHHPAGTVVTIEGPRFSTRAESRMFRAWGADVINMSVAPECALANELSLPYASVAMSTDYDCWKEGEEPVTWEAVLKIFSENVAKVTNLLQEVIPRIGRGEAGPGKVRG
jgi:5'-methylthioadenosine phosphorylase